MRNVLFLILLPFLLAAQDAPAGDWEGAISIGGMNLGIAVHFSQVDAQLKATIDIPQQGAHNLPLQNVKFNQPQVYFELPAGPGLAVFDGIRKEDTIDGTFVQGAASGTFSLTPLKKTVKDTTLSYNETDVTFGHGDITLSGTLLSPKKTAPKKAVVFVTGSGLQDRDEDIMGFKIFKTLAEYLAQNGIASLRYDDRGFGKSSGDAQNATTKDFADDAASAIDYLTNKSGLNILKTGIIGHSEGALIAGMLASQSKDIDFIVLMAGSAIPGDQLLLEQGQLVNQVMGFSRDDADAQRAMQEKIFKTIRSNSGWDVLEQELRDAIKEKLYATPVEERRHIADPKQYIENAVAAQMQQIRSPWMKFFIDYNPADDLKKIDIPTLALFGGKDVQVPAKSNMQIMQEIFENRDSTQFTIKLFPEANHLFQKAKTGSPAEYGRLKHQFVDGFLELTRDWIIRL